MKRRGFADMINLKNRYT